MFSKKLRHKIQFQVRVESIEQIPSAYINTGGIKIAYAKGKQPSHKGETDIVPCTSQNVIIGQELTWKTKLQKDEKTGLFEPKVIVFKLKHATTEGHKERTLGTADVDLSQLCNTPLASTRLDVQFAAKNQGKLKTKATLLVNSRWLKVGDKPFDHSANADGTTRDRASTNGNGMSLHFQDADDQFFTADTIMTTPVFGDDGTVSELSDTSSVAGEVEDGNEDSNVIFESADLDLDHPSNVPPLSARRSSQYPRISSTNGSNTSVLQHPGQSTSPILSPIPEVATLLSTEDIPNDLAQQRVSPRQRLTPQPMGRQSSHPDVRSVDSSTEYQQHQSQIRSSAPTGNGPKDPRMHSASMSVLPEFIDHSLALPMGAQVQHSGSGPITRQRGKSTSSSAHRPLSPPSGGAGSHSSMMMPSASHASVQHQSQHPQAIIRAPVETAPYISYIDNDAPELPQSAQHSLVFLAPNAFAIQSAAISGDEVARLRAEVLDKNLKISLLGKQVGILEMRWADSNVRLEDAERRDSERASHVAHLERKLKRILKRHPSKMTDDSTTMEDVSSSTSSGGNTGAATARGDKKRRKKRAHNKHSDSSLMSGDSSNSNSMSSLPTTDLSSSSSSTGNGGRRFLWTPEEERRGFVLFLATILFLILLFYASPTFRNTLSYSFEQIGVQVPLWNTHPPALPSESPTDLAHSSDIFSAATQLSEAFASALNLTATPIPEQGLV